MYTFFLRFLKQIGLLLILVIGLIKESFGVATLTPSLLTLALSVNCPLSSTSSSCILKNNELAGKARKIIIQNNSLEDATNVLINSTDLPIDTHLSYSNCDTILANGGTCVITVTPGNTVSNDIAHSPCTSGVHPTGEINITADGGLSMTVGTYVLSYGCLYQGGFIYSIDDTTNNTISIGGKTAAIADSYPGQTSPLLSTPNWGGYGIDMGANLYETSTQGSNDGKNNTATIINVLTTNYSNPPYNGSAPVALSDYASGLCSTLSTDENGTASCTAPSTCFSEWYLPTICDFGMAKLGSKCTDSGTIYKQLFQNPLILHTSLGLLNGGFYWTSTQPSFDPLYNAWFWYFSSSGSGSGVGDKRARMGVRCVRALTV